MLHLIFDTETTGMKAWKKPCTDPAQPKLVQFAAALYDDELDAVVSTVDLTVRPSLVEDSWDIPAGAANVHGVTTDIAKLRGVPLYAPVDLFKELVAVADVLVAHNINYDVTVMRRAAMMVADAYGDDYVDPFKDKATYCTMQAATPILKIRKSRGGYKWPNLNECMQHFYGVDVDNAHNALADVNATVQVYKALAGLGDRAQAAAA